MRKMATNRAAYIWILLCLLGLSGCFFGNAEGYGRKPGSDSGPNAASPLTLPYYWIDPTYTCVPEGKTEAIPSYRNSITVAGTQAFSEGDLCHRTHTPVELSDIEFSSTRQYIAYKDGLYLFADAGTVQTLRPVETLCFAESPKDDEVFDIAIRNPVRPEDVLTAHVQFKINEAYLPVSRQEDSNVRAYLSNLLELVIQMAQTELHHLGELKFSSQNLSLSQHVRCRFRR